MERMQRPLVAVQRSAKEAIPVTKKLPRDGNGPSTMFVSLLFVDAIHTGTQRFAAVDTFWAVLYRQRSLAVFSENAKLLVKRTQGNEIAALV